jgi:SAM-dependent methyltransferase
MIKNVHYDGWELPFFDAAVNFRNYQIKIIKKHIKGSVSEIGPGNGSLCEKYYKYCGDITLFEPSRNFSKDLKERFNNISNIEVIESTFYPSEKKFDSILLMDVLEHVENPETLIKKLYENLKIGGKILINVPAFEHLYSNFDKDVGHLKRYNKNSLLKETALITPQNIEMFYYDSIGYFLSLFSKISSLFFKNYKKNFQQKIAFWNFLMPVSSVLDKISFNTLGKSLFIIITK